LYPTSTGKCFLAHVSARRLDGYLEAHLPAKARPLVERELEGVRAHGFVTNRGDTLPHIRAAASPIVVAGRVVACLGVAGPPRMADKLDEPGNAVLAPSRATAKRLGGR
jgi:DNA-binding IclR family transcriptional regulator